MPLTPLTDDPEVAELWDFIRQTVLEIEEQKPEWRRLQDQQRAVGVEAQQKRRSEEALGFLACASFLKINPGLISGISLPTDDGGHFTGIKVEIFISALRSPGQWLEQHKPKTLTDEQKKFIKTHLLTYL